MAVLKNRSQIGLTTYDKRLPFWGNNSENYSLKFRSLNTAQVSGQIGFIDTVCNKCSAWTVAHTFLPEAISIAAGRVAQYLGLN
jgi:hypothetical protein